MVMYVLWSYCTHPINLLSLINSQDHRLCSFTLKTTYEHKLNYVGNNKITQTYDTYYNIIYGQSY